MTSSERRAGARLARPAGATYVARLPGATRLAGATGIACLAADRRRARAAARLLSRRMPGIVLQPHSLRSYLAARQPPERIIVCADGAPPREPAGLLRRLAARLLWPVPAADFRDAIGGLRTRAVGPRAAAASRSAPRETRIAAALLLEGPVDGERVRAALSAGAPRDWVVESARHVSIGAGLLGELARRGVRWSVLEPVEVVAVFARPHLLRRRKSWSRLLPRGTPVWVWE